MRITVHGGHAAAGKAYCGAVGLLDESRENRKVKDAVIKYLRMANAESHDCTVDVGTSQKNVLKQICDLCNSVSADINISIHFNSGRDDNTGDSKQGGFECYAVSYTGIKKEVADRIVKNMQDLGFKMHGDPLKTTGGLYVLNNTNKPTLLLEICFVDDRDDYELYNKVSPDKIGKAIAEGIVGKSIPVPTTIASNLSPNTVYKGFPHARGHIQSIGWDNAQGQGELVGKIGKRLEAVKIDYPGVLLYAKAHIQSIGDVDYGKITSNTVIGTVGKSKRLEALYLKGRIQFRVFIENTGWTSWNNATNGVWLGTKGKSKAIQAVQFKAL